MSGTTELRPPNVSRRKHAAERARADGEKAQKQLRERAGRRRDRRGPFPIHSPRRAVLTGGCHCLTRATPPPTPIDGRLAALLGVAHDHGGETRSRRPRRQRSAAARPPAATIAPRKRRRRALPDRTRRLRRREAGHAARESRHPRASTLRARRSDSSAWTRYTWSPRRGFREDGSPRTASPSRDLTARSEARLSPRRAPGRPRARRP